MGEQEEQGEGAQELSCYWTSQRACASVLTTDGDNGGARTDENEETGNLLFVYWLAGLAHGVAGYSRHTTDTFGPPMMNMMGSIFSKAQLLCFIRFYAPASPEHHQRASRLDLVLYLGSVYRILCQSCLCSCHLLSASATLTRFTTVTTFYLHYYRYFE